MRAWRFDYKIFVDYPDLEARIEIWKIYISKSKMKSTNSNIFEENLDYENISKKSDNLTWADISEIIRRLKEQFALNFDINSKIEKTQILEEIEKYKTDLKFWNNSNKKIWFEV